MAKTCCFIVGDDVIGSKRGDQRVPSQIADRVEAASGGVVDRRLCSGPRRADRVGPTRASEPVAQAGSADKDKWGSTVHIVVRR